MMDTQFSVFEVLQIAEEVELKAVRFYLRAAERFADKERRSICYSLADRRARHQGMWKRIRHRYSEKTGEFGIFDPDDYVLSNPWTMAGLTGYGSDPNGRSRLTGCETRDQILYDAIRRSRDVTTFYRGLKGFAHSPDSHLMIDNMISEEHRHIRWLTRELERMQASAEDREHARPVCWAEPESRQ